MPQRYEDTWHQLEAANERAWLDQWARAELRDPAATGSLHYAVMENPSPVEPAPPIDLFITA